MSAHFQKQLRCLGMESSPTSVREPEGNARIERFFRILKEPLLQVRHYRDPEGLQLELRDFRDRYGHEWSIERLQSPSPRQAHKRFLGLEQAP